MTSSLPPRRRDSRNLADLLRQDRIRLGQLDRGLVGGRFPSARPVRANMVDEDEDDFDSPAILFANTDHASATGAGQSIGIRLTHIPEPGSEQVYYNGTPLKWSDWSRTDTVLTIPGEQWFKAGDVAWVDYAYYEAEEPDVTTPTLVGYTTVVNNASSIAVPAGTQAGDLLVLVLSARINAACSDGRFDAGYHHTAGTAWSGGIWLGTADGSGSAVSITLDSTAADGGVDCVGALAAFTGSPLTITAEADTHSSGSPMNPAVPSSGSFGIAGISMGAGLVAGSISTESTGAWTDVVKLGNQGSGKSSVYIGYSTAGTPAGTWTSTGGSDNWDARILGVQ